MKSISTLTVLNYICIDKVHLKEDCLMMVNEFSSSSVGSLTFVP